MKVQRAGWDPLDGLKAPPSAPVADDGMGSTMAGVAVLPPGRAVQSRLAFRLLTFFAVMGPGLIVMEADNDAGAVSTYTQAGAQYGTHLFRSVASRRASSFSSSPSSARPSRHGNSSSSRVAWPTSACALQT